MKLERLVGGGGHSLVAALVGAQAPASLTYCSDYTLILAVESVLEVVICCPGDAVAGREVYRTLCILIVTHLTIPNEERETVLITRMETSLHL